MITGVVVVVAWGEGKFWQPITKKAIATINTKKCQKFLFITA
jgi:hypothetical protein